ncbi:MAG TPA: hydroxysqualene dehydroxylase HpnE [Jatrophihabitantaceae bacterium]|nr:hydroxysqualene dehydroxylase HpnE [Jatrophihabitantaceae bacterium]
MADRHDVVIVGGGLAGISAALRFADCGRSVTLLEGRPRLGGAAFSFRRGELDVDNGQHVFLRCCEAYRWLLRRIGATERTYLQPRLDIPVLDPSGRQGRLGRAPGVPAPAHLGAALSRYALLSPLDRLRAVRGALALRMLSPDDLSLDARTLGDYLRRHGQNDATIDALWGVVATATLNLHPDDASLALAAKVFRTGLLDAATAADVGYATAPLGRLHHDAAGRALRAAGVDVRLGQKARRVEPGLVHLAEGGSLSADAVVLAVPHREAFALLPELRDTPAAPARDLGATPIVNVHVIYERPVTDLAFAAAVRSPVQWIFDRTHTSGLDRVHPGGQYLAVTVSAADDIVDVPAKELTARYVAELSRLLPAAAPAQVRDAFVTRERRATFRQAAGSAAMRPPTDAGPDGVWLAGSWTATGWPDTMESAVRSGVRAAESAMRTCPPETLRFAA